jgi:chaperonin GroEL
MSSGIWSKRSTEPRTGSTGAIFTGGGILDPCKVTATSLRNAASVGKLVLATRTLIADKPQSYDPTSGPSRGGGAERFGMDYQSAEVAQ